MRKISDKRYMIQLLKMEVQKADQIVSECRLMDLPKIEHYSTEYRETKKNYFSQTNCTNCTY